jgi:hypothetical protein
MAARSVHVAILRDGRAQARDLLRMTVEFVARSAHDDVEFVS